MELSAVQRELSDVQPLASDHQIPHAGGHDDARLVESGHILHSGYRQTLPAIQLQPVVQGSAGDLICHKKSSFHTHTYYDMCMKGALRL